MAKPALNQFNGGELSPVLSARVDLPKYNYSTEKSLNFIPLIEGSTKKRGGSHFVKPVKEVDAVHFSIKVIPEDADAIVYINNEMCSEIYLAPGEKVTYTVSAEGYLPISGSYIVEEDVEITINLVSTLYRSTLTIVTDPSDAVVYINGELGNSKTVITGSTATYRVEKSGYTPIEKSVQVPADMTIEVKLGMTFEIVPDPFDAKVIINGVETKKIDVQPGDVVTWSVSKDGYTSKSGEETIESSMIMNVSLGVDGYALNQVIFEESNPGKYLITIEKTGYYDVMICSPGGGGGGAATAYGVHGRNGSSGAVYAGKIRIEKGWKVSVLLGVPGVGGAGHKAEGSDGGYYFSADQLAQSITYVGAGVRGFFVAMYGGHGGEGGNSGSSTTYSGAKFIEFDPTHEVQRRIKKEGVKYSTLSPLNNGFGGGGVGGTTGRGNDGGRAYCKIVYLGQA